MGAGGPGQPVRHGCGDPGVPAAPAGRPRHRGHRRLHAGPAGGERRHRLLRVQVRGPGVHPGAGRRTRRPRRGHPADPRRDAHRLLRRPHRTVQARPGRRSGRPGEHRGRGADRATATRRHRDPGNARDVLRRDLLAVTRSGSPARSGAGLPAPPPMHITRTCDTAVLVLRALGLGDALTAVPALRGIRRAWPDRWLLLAADARIGGWLRGLGLVDEVLPTPALRPLIWPPPAVIGTSGHLAVNLHGRGPQSHRTLAATVPDRLVAFRQPSAAHLDGPTWRRDEHEVDRWCRLVGSAGGACGRDDLLLPAAGPRSGEVLLHPGAAAPARRWPADRWAGVAARLAGSGHPVALTGGPAESDLCDDIVARARHLARSTADVRNLAGRLDLPA